MLGMAHRLIAPPNDFIGLARTYSSLPGTTRSSVSSPTTPLFAETTRFSLRNSETAHLHNGLLLSTPGTARPLVSATRLLVSTPGTARPPISPPQHIEPLPSWPSKVPWNGAKRRENHLPNHTMKTRQCSSEETTYLNEMPCLLVPKRNMEHVEHVSGCCVGQSLLLCRPELTQDHWKQYKYPAMFAF
jgi:hypothetical protein